jgi:hypothetical protein
MLTLSFSNFAALSSPSHNERFAASGGVARMTLLSNSAPRSRPNFAYTTTWRQAAFSLCAILGQRVWKTKCNLNDDSYADK